MKNAAYNLFEAMRHLTLFTLDFGNLVFRFLKFVTGVEYRKIQREADAEKKLVLCVANPTPASTDFSSYEPTTIFSHRVCDAQKVPLGTMKFWFSQTDGTYYRDFTFLSVKISRTLGLRNVPLAPVKLAKGDALAALKEDTLREIESILNDRINRVQPIPTYMERTVAQRAPATASPFTREDQPMRSPRTDVLDAEVKTPPPTPRPTVEESRNQSSASARSPGARVLSQYDGVFLAAGVGKRSIKNSRSYGPEYIDVDQFYVDIRLIATEARGAVHRVWGADLERALHASAVQTDDLIRVLHKGRTQVVNTDDGTKAFKNLYEVIRIGGKRK